MDGILLKTIPYCQRCPLQHRGYALPRITGKEIMVVGEAPGEEEEKQERAFVGKSGQLLDKWLSFMGIENKVWITNVVKHRPPDNRTPTLEEISSCLPYLKAEISYAKPKYLFLLGRTASSILSIGGDMKGVIKRTIVEDVRFEGVRSVVFYHPSYILRTGKDPYPVLAYIRDNVFNQKIP
ncbi:MAG: uracil-DNA glycosylase [Candidatus Kryptoniota bacterium]